MFISMRSIFIKRVDETSFNIMDQRSVVNKHQTLMIYKRVSVRPCYAHHLLRQISLTGR
jgi:hypothetical protein